MRRSSLVRWYQCVGGTFGDNLYGKKVKKEKVKLSL
jgi:hypothetical protein